MLFACVWKCVYVRVCLYSGQPVSTTGLCAETETEKAQCAGRCKGGQDGCV